MDSKRFRQEADIGDLVLFTNDNFTTIGFVMRIEEKYALLSNRETRNADGSVRKPGMFHRFPDETQWKEKYKYWDTYEMVRKTPYAGKITFVTED